MLLRRMVTDDEFNKALNDINNTKIIGSVLSKYRSSIPEEDLKSCGLDALWRCLGYHRPDKNNKFTSSLWRFTTWECRRKLKSILREKSRQVINISTIESNNTFDIPSLPDSIEITHLRECINLLGPIDRELVQQYFFERRTMEEIGRLHGYSKEAARQKLNKAKKELSKLYDAGV